MNVARYLFSATVMNGYIYVAGGHDGREFLNSVGLYDPKNDEWIQITPMNRIRIDFALLNFNGFLYALGYVPERFDPLKREWTEVNAQSSGNTINTKTNAFRIGFQIESFDGSNSIAAAIEIDGKIIAIMSNGTFGQLKFDENGGCSFVLLSKSKNKADFSYQHYLCHN